MPKPHQYSIIYIDLKQNPVFFPFFRYSDIGKKKCLQQALLKTIMLLFKADSGPVLRSPAENSLGKNSGCNRKRQN